MRWPMERALEVPSSPIRIVPLMCTPARASRMADEAVSLMPSRSIFPIQRPAERAAASVARTSSSPMFGWAVRGSAMLPEGAVGSVLTRR